jgi:hypothetical protein
MMIEGSGSRAGSSGSIPLTSESGSGGPTNMWIRIRNTEKNPIPVKLGLFGGIGRYFIENFMRFITTLVLTLSLCKVDVFLEKTLTNP